MTFDLGLLTALLQVAMIDLVLAGDNAIVIGLAAAGLPPRLRPRAIFIGILAATCLRIAFALLAAHLMQLVGLVLAGGLLLLWVCWKMWQELRHTEEDDRAAEAALGDGLIGGGPGVAAGSAGAAPARAKTLGQAVTQIVIADVSMSVDNVLAVAGASRDHYLALVLGLVLSIALMGIASAYIARLLNRHRWIAYIGLAIILFVALRMIYEGAGQVLAQAAPLLAPAP